MTPPRTAPPAPSATAPQWFFGRWPDLLIGCGLWAVLLMPAAQYAATHWAVQAAFAFYILSFVCNFPHYFATIHRAYGTRADFNKYKFFTIYVTGFMVLTAALTHLSRVVLPTSMNGEINLVSLFVTFYLTWSPYHYTGQNFGLAMMFLRRNGASPTPLQRNMLSWGFFVSYLVLFITIHSGAGSTDGLTIPIFGWMNEHLGVSLEWTMPVRVALIGLFLVMIGYVAVSMGRQIGFSRALPAWVLMGTQALWFCAPAAFEVAGKAAPAVYYSSGILAFMHCAQYLWITSYYTKRETESGLRGDGVWRPFHYFFTLVLGGIFLFLPGPWLTSRIGGYDFTESFLIFTALVNVHHFMLDGAIWKLRDGRIAALLLGSKDQSAVGGGALGSALTAAAAWLTGRAMAARGLRWVGAAGLLGLAAVDITYHYFTRARRSIEATEIAARINPNDSQHAFTRASLHAEAGNLEAAYDEIQRGVLLNPFSAPVRRLLPLIMARKGVEGGNPLMMNEAWSEFASLPMLFLPDGPTLANWGILSARIGRNDEAVRMLLRALSVEPGQLPVQRALGDAYLGLGQHDKAIVAYVRVLELTREKTSDERTIAFETIPILMRIGDVHASKGDIRGAVQWFGTASKESKSLGDSGRSAEALSRIGDVLATVGDVPGAERAFREAVAAARASGYQDAEGRIWFNYALFLVNQAGRVAEGYAGMLHARELLAYTPEEAQARDAVQRLEGVLGPVEAERVRAGRAAMIESLAPGSAPAG